MSESDSKIKFTFRNIIKNIFTSKNSSNEKINKNENNKKINYGSIL